MKAEIEVIEDKIYYSIPELEIEIELTQHSDGVEPGFFTDEDSDRYWDEHWEDIEKEVLDFLADQKFREQGSKIDFGKDQHLLSIRKKGKELGWIEVKNGKLVTTGEIGEKTCENFVELIMGLQGHGIEIDNFYT